MDRSPDRERLAFYLRLDPPDLGLMFMPPVFPAHWHVSQPVLIADTFSSLVWKVSLPDGTPAIVKGLKPIEDIADELRGADYLVWRNGREQSGCSVVRTI